MAKSRVFLIFLSLMLPAACRAFGQDATQREDLNLEPTDYMEVSIPEVAKTTWWQPTVGLTWQWQLTGKLDLNLQTCDKNLFKNLDMNL